MKRALLLFVTIFFALNNGHGQTIYVSTMNGLLKRVDITNQGLISTPVPGCNSGSYFSIARDGNKFYFANGSLYSASLTNTPEVVNCQLIGKGVATNAMTVDNRGVVYFVTQANTAQNNQLFAVLPGNETPVFAGKMPYNASGDLIFYKNELYMAALEGIIKVPLNDPSKSTIYIPVSQYTIYGLASALVNGKNTVYSIAETGTSPSEVAELDMDGRSIKRVAGTLDYQTNDAGSEIADADIPFIADPAIAIVRNCTDLNKARVEVTFKAHTGQYTFTLNKEVNTTGVFENVKPGNYQVVITSNENAIRKPADFTVTNNITGSPTISVAKIDPKCTATGQIKLSAGADNPNFKIQYDGNIYGFDHAFAGLGAGVYHFIILSNNGCMVDAKDYTLTQEDCSVIAINNIDIKQKCDAYNQATVTVMVGAHPDTYTYTLNGVSNTTGVFDAVAPGTYNVVITSPTDSKQQQVVIPDYSLSPDAITYSIKKAVCDLPGEIKFSVNDNSADAAQIKHGSAIYPFDKVITGLSAGTNNFTILNSQGCIIDVLAIDIPQDDCRAIVFPNTFTPNSDGINDIFKPEGDTGPADYKLRIYTRQGALIFQSLSFFNGWDGKYKGKLLPFGVYYWIANYNLSGGKPATQSGYVTLIR